MLKNHLTIAVRTLLKNKVFSLINVAGLAIATTAFLLIMYYVQFEYSYEGFNAKADHIYRVTLDLYKGAEYVATDSETYPALAPALKTQMPEVADYVRVQHVGECEAGVKEKSILVERVYAADASLFSMFSFSFLKGNPTEALRQPMQAVLTETVARKIFGSTDVVGKVFHVKPLTENVTVAGVIQDIPENTHLKLDIILSLITLEKLGRDMNSWNSNNNYTYVELKPGTTLVQLNQTLKNISKERLKNEMLTAEPIKDIHLYSHKGFEPEVNGDIQIVRFLIAIAIVILLIGLINYVNLTTARVIERAKEVGIRKTLGSSKVSLIHQFLVESALINVAALLISLLLIQLCLPLYTEIIGKPIPTTIFQNRNFWYTLAFTFLVNNLLSGIYPAIFLSSARPSLILQRRFSGSPQSSYLRKGLVVTEFAASVILIATTFIVYQQVHFMRSQKLGMDASQILVVTAPVLTGNDSVSLRNKEVFRNELLKKPYVQQVAGSSSVPGVSIHELNTQNSIVRYGSDDKAGYNYYLYGIDAHFIPTLGIEMAAGRNFFESSPNAGDVIINEEAARQLGFASPAEAIGGKINLPYYPGTAYSTIVGVIKNFHQRSLKETHLPLIHWYNGNYNNFYTLKIDTKHAREIVTATEKTWQQLFPGQTLEYYFLNEMFDQQYKSEFQFGKITGIFSGMAIFIACLGLFGLASFAISQRTKEIGVRKVLGASVSNIVLLLSKDFLRLVLIAFVVAAPIAWYGLHQWLQNFAYRIDVSFWILVLAGILTGIIALLTISFQAIKAAVMNPVKSLRNE
ncbi:FtsX-like permease family protein [Rhodocytophaga rosea]|uniref:FtsX-like permease family protein n=1 Tax=Rhodocytophaga rosea TaxID=2704465 RepID=A0A6C0GNL8_9BACT|nr:ABC transporter permease [Rhodocytophaga rosea]QHT69220.1 FtsX-like permease family protein [Rhodocytophaga rosea]